jgi:hypothetical protein
LLKVFFSSTPNPFSFLDYLSQTSSTSFFAFLRLIQGRSKRAERTGDSAARSRALLSLPPSARLKKGKTVRYGRKRGEQKKRERTREGKFFLFCFFLKNWLQLQKYRTLFSFAWKRIGIYFICWGREEKERKQLRFSGEEEKEKEKGRKSVSFFFFFFCVVDQNFYFLYFFNSTSTPRRAA